LNSSHLTNLNGVRGRSRYHAAMEHNTADRAPDADVLIVGAGPAGLALASALSGLGLRCTIVEQQGLPLLEAPGDDGREIALTHRARRVLESLGIWQSFF
jgi:ribulose 1,5-bisphosphate synthetase/thiazole synthase